jgi:hypothetical protein
MYKLDKTIVSTATFQETENAKKFDAKDSLAERLKQGWYLTCMSYGIDYNNPPKMEKKLFSIRKHQH